MPFDGPPVRDFPDRAFRELLKDLSNLEDLLQAAVPQQAALLDIGRATLLDRTFLLPDWRERESDLFFQIPLRVPIADRHMLVCLLLEHQSEPDPCIPLRTYLFAAWYWERQWKAWQTSHPRGEPLRLTAILPLVLHTGLVPWGTNRSLAAMIESPPEFAQFAPVWQPQFYDLAEHSVDELLRAATPWLRALALVRAEEEAPARFQQVFTEVLRRLEPVQGTQPVRWSDLMWFVLSWAAKRRPESERPQLRTMVERALTNAARQQEILNMAQRTLRTWDDEVEERVARSKADAAVQTCKQNLRSLLQRKFGTIPAAVLQRIEESNDLERLQASVPTVLDLQSPDQLSL